jgi:hypothetical protein
VSSRPFADTMEMAYLLQTEAQGLKALAWKYLRIKTPGWSDVVEPYWKEAILAHAEGVASADTVVEALTKTGKPRKKPLLKRGPTAKMLATAIKNQNAELIAKKLPDFPEPNSRQVPLAVMADYATLDPWLTARLYPILQARYTQEVGE